MFDPTGGVPDMTHKRLRVLHDLSLSTIRRAFFAPPVTPLGMAGPWIKRAGPCSNGDIGPDPRTVSLVRLRHELFRLLEEDDPVDGLRLAWEWGLWAYWDPRLEFSEDLAAKLASLPRRSPPVNRLAVLFGGRVNSAKEILTRFSAWWSLKKVLSDQWERVEGRVLVSGSPPGGEGGLCVDGLFG